MNFALGFIVGAGWMAFVLSGARLCGMNNLAADESEAVESENQ